MIPPYDVTYDSFNSGLRYVTSDLTFIIFWLYLIEFRIFDSILVAATTVIEPEVAAELSLRTEEPHYVNRAVDGDEKEETCEFNRLFHFEYIFFEPLQNSEKFRNIWNNVSYNYANYNFDSYPHPNSSYLRIYNVYLILK